MPIRADSRPLRRRSGVSLLEAVVAVAIVGMTSISALDSVGSGMCAAEKSKRAIEAEALASSRLQFMDLMSDAQLQSLPDSVAKGKFAAPLDNYSWTTTSAPLSEQAGVYDVHVTVTWETGAYTVKTYLYRQPVFTTRR